MARPPGPQSGRSVHSLCVYIDIRSACILPRDDRPTRLIRDDSDELLVSRVLADRDSDALPEDIPLSIDHLHIYVLVGAPAILPGDDEEARPAACDARRLLIARLVADGYPLGIQEDSAARAQMLNIDRVFRHLEMTPGDYRPTEAIRSESMLFRVAVAYRHTLLTPEDIAEFIDALTDNTPVIPNDDRSEHRVGNDLRGLLVTARYADSDTINEPLRMKCRNHDEGG